jgi:integral membrane protein
VPPDSADTAADRTPGRPPARATTSVTAAGPTTGLPPKIKAALGRYRVAAFVVGVGLLILCLTMVLKYVFDVPEAVAIWGPIHGILYIAYVLLAFDLAYKDRWSAKGTILVLLAGVIPVLSFYAEHVVTRKVNARQKV